MPRWTRLGARALPLPLLMTLTLAGCSAPAATPTPMEKSMLRIIDVYPDKASYRPGESPTVRVELANDGPAPFAGRLLVELYALTERLGGSEQEIRLPAGPTPSIVDVQMTLPADDFRGYGVEVRALDATGALVAEAATALDVLSAWWLAPRYGFLSDFAPGEPDSEARVAQLARYHVDVVQFYDWMYRHYQLLPPPGEVEYTDALGRRLSLATVQAKIAACHKRNMAALAYGAVYGAEPEFADQHPDWLLYQADGRPQSLANLFYITDIRPGSPWNDLLIDEYRRTVGEVGFDGIHMDQYGFPKVAYTQAPERALVNVEDQFAPLIDRAAAAVREEDAGARVLFNAVNNWPTPLVAEADQPATYIEVWPPHTSYLDLRTLITDTQRLSGGKPVILAAYLSPFCDPGAAPPEQLAAGARLAMSAIFANGGYHLLLGERDGVLCDPYYPKHGTLPPELARDVRRYYDFIVRYEELLFDPALEDVSTSHVGGVNTEVTLEGLPYSPMARGGTVWTILRRKPGSYTLSLVNLTGDENTEWNAPHPPPPSLADVEVTLNGDLPLVQAFWASPDEPPGRLTPLPLAREGGRWHVTIPRLDYWGLVWLQTEE